MRNDYEGSNFTLLGFTPMRTIIRDEKGNEEILFEDRYGYIVVFIFFTIIFFIFFFVLTHGILRGSWLILSLMIDALLGYYSIFEYDHNIIYDIKIKQVIIEKRRVTNMKIKWKETEKIGFSDIKEVNVIETSDGDGFHYVTKLNMVDGNRKIDALPALNTNHKIVVEKVAIRLCEMTGFKGYYIDKKKNSIPLNIAVLYP